MTLLVAVHILLDRFSRLMVLSGAILMSQMHQITDGARNMMWCQYRRFQLTRLETRTKESNIYASIWVANPQCAMKVKGMKGFSKKNPGNIDRP